jgi:hypothetical protein
MDRIWMATSLVHIYNEFSNPINYSKLAGLKRIKLWTEKNLLPFYGAVLIIFLDLAAILGFAEAYSKILCIHEM